MRIRQVFIPSYKGVSPMLLRAGAVVPPTEERIGTATGLREIGHVSLVEALELTLLIARKEPHRHRRVAARWLLRYLEEHPATTIEEACVVAASRSALGSPVHDEAERTLRAMTDRPS